MTNMTETERKALAKFANEYGHQWKAYLKAAWLSYKHNGRNMGGKDSGTLREIRNVRGMRWLEKVRTADLHPVRTKDNTEPMAWWKLAKEAFAERGLSEPLYGETRDAYEMGETPETWAEYVLHAGPDFPREPAPATFRTSADGVLVLGFTDEQATIAEPVAPSFMVIYRPHNTLVLDTRYFGPFATHADAYDFLCELPAIGKHQQPQSGPCTAGVKFVQQLTAPSCK